MYKISFYSDHCLHLPITVLTVSNNKMNEWKYVIISISENQAIEKQRWSQESDCPVWNEIEEGCSAQFQLVHIQHFYTRFIKAQKSRTCPNQKCSKENCGKMIFLHCIWPLDESWSWIIHFRALALTCNNEYWEHIFSSVSYLEGQ